jgi:acyl-CoA synthetase (NDP forming)
MISSDLDKMFNPRSVAVVGAKQIDPKIRYLGMFGSIQEYGFKGRLYPINTKLPEVNGLKAYSNLSQLPEPVDLVIVSVPAPYVPEVLKDCARTGNTRIHIFTAGFKETGEPQALALQKEIETIAFKHRLKVIGPNCMGICVPEIRLGTWNTPVEKVGSVSFISQSGGHAQDFSNYASKFGVGFSKIVSYGNALTLDSTDFLEYFAQDPKTRIITMYLEGIKDSRKLFNQVREINKTKPVIILKGGLTEAGKKAVASHTGSLAGQEHFWNAFFRQTGAIRAYSLEGMAHTVMAMLHLPAPMGHGVAVMGTGGGVVVAASDVCSRAGLKLPPFSNAMQKTLRKFVPEAGNMIKNPLDAQPIIIEAEKLMPETLDMMYEAPDINMVILSLHMDWIGPAATPAITSAIKSICPAHLKDKPFVVCWRQTRHDPEMEQVCRKMEAELIEAGIPVYRDFEHTADALSRLAGYHEYLRKQKLLSVNGEESTVMQMAS